MLDIIVGFGAKKKRGGDVIYKQDGDEGENI